MGILGFKSGARIVLLAILLLAAGLRLWAIRSEEHTSELQSQ